MTGSTTVIKDPNSGEEKKFNFDYSYWSHDGCKEMPDGTFVPDTSHPNGKKFADQKKVYQDLGEGVLKNAWDGFNSTLFAYGQTGSGKSWSIVGYGVNKGVVPLFCENMFKGIDEKKKAADKTEYEVTYSMLEIYNEQVRDLLDPNGGNKRGGLRIRQHPKTGFYVEGLIIVPVQSYKDIETKMDEGTRNRTVAATNMNATSSRAHTIVGINFIQKFRNAAGEDTTKSAVINLVDLAGSERAESTGATGDRLKEGAAINQSLSCLGNCIAALAEKSGGKDVKVPFRDSVLTKLLKNALGGNSKTIMIAAISPADINFDESLSTLRYADRAKQIKTSATVNEDPTEKLIRELQEENEKLKAMLGGEIKMEKLKGDHGELDDEGMEEEYKVMLANNEKQMEEMRKSFEEKLKEAQQASGENTQAMIAAKKKNTAYMYNLNTDPFLTGHIINFFDTPAEKIGNGKDEGETELVLTGPGIAPKHAIVRMEGDKFTLEPGEPNVRLMHNGKAVVDKVELHHNDRVLFGTTQYFVFVHPKERDASKKTYPEVTFEMAQSEIAKNSGFDISANKSTDEALLQEDVLDLMPAIENANSISEDLDKKMKFELMVVSPEARGELAGRTQVMIRVINLETKHEWVWPREKFLNRKFVMQEMYQNFLDNEEWDLPKEKDPFDEDYSADFHIGSVKVWMQSLSFMIESKVQLEITDYRGKNVGLLNVEVIPCDPKGKEFTDKDDVYLEDTQQLIDKPVNFVFKIISARGLPSHFTDVYAKYLVYKEESFTSTDVVKNTANPDWNHKRVLCFPKADEELLKFLKESAVMVQIWGKQKPPKEKKNVNTKMAILAQAKAKGGIAAANDNQKRFDADKVKYMMEVTMLKKRQEKMEAKLRHIKQMLEAALEHKKKRISTDLISQIYNAGTEDQAQKCIKLVPKEKGKPR
ncbi:kinesin-like protein KIF28P isoform X3 [Physella acuta]|uniref:kinesin-like protein KIF28P isoform X3 n=1 Tax=Physella acuta TaxID=109671 RepID=UPI0027DD5B42|nr:kinesin-like protein KIF28P isoform X3 [Physella acuta]